MNTIIATLFIIFTFNYCEEAISWIITWKKTKRFSPSGTSHEAISLVVTMHNEEKNVERLVTSIIGQTRQVDEVIYVLDHCTDKTEEKIAALIKPNMRIIKNEQQQGKKTAQKLGISHTTHKTICIVDGDCCMGEKWCESITAYIAEHAPNILIAPVVMRGKGGLTQRLFELDFLALQMATAGTALQGRATMCNGANMAFRTEDYDNHDAKTKYASGDDMFLLAALKARKGKVMYVNNEDTLVSTWCPDTIGAFFRQRTRWLRKSTGYTDMDLKRLAITMFCGNITWPAALVYCIFDPHYGKITLELTFAAKFITDFVLLKAGSSFWNVKVRFFDVIVLAILYPFMMLAICFGCIFRSKKSW